MDGKHYHNTNIHIYIYIHICIYVYVYAYVCVCIYIYQKYINMYLSGQNNVYVRTLYVHNILLKSMICNICIYISHNFSGKCLFYLLRGSWIPCNRQVNLSHPSGSSFQWILVENDDILPIMIFFTI